MGYNRLPEPHSRMASVIGYTCSTSLRTGLAAAVEEAAGRDWTSIRWRQDKPTSHASL